MNHSFKQFPPGTDHFSWHAAYLGVYERLFERIKHLPHPVLEIGTDGSGGLQMYADYFKNARVFGMDINPIPSAIIGHPKIEHIQIDAYTQEAVSQAGLWAGVGYSLICEDGPHYLSTQEFFVANYPQLLHPEGLAVVEDVADISHIPILAAQLPPGFVGFGVDMRHTNGRYDDILFVIQRA